MQECYGDGVTQAGSVLSEWARCGASSASIGLTAFAICVGQYPPNMRIRLCLASIRSITPLRSLRRLNLVGMVSASAQGQKETSPFPGRQGSRYYRSREP